MREPVCCAEVRFRLARHGLPPARIERIVAELAEHWEDLRSAALAQGLSEIAAAAQADARLGPPRQLAGDIVTGLGRTSWLGRHPVITLGLLPLLFTPLLMGAIILPLWGLDELVHFSNKENIEAVRNSHLIAGGLWIVYGAALIATPVWLCCWIWRAGLGLRWILAACSWCALFALMRHFEADALKRTIAVGLRFPWRLDITTALILLLHIFVAAAFVHSARKATSNTCEPVENKPSSSI
jgi:hypothetical protein